MANIDTLKSNGVIAQSATFNDADTKFINDLTTAEVNALISIKGKISPEFVSNHIGSAGPTAKAIGIVF